MLGGVAINCSRDSPVPHQMHEAADRVGFGGVARNPRGIEGFRRRIAAADPHRENRLRRIALLAMLLGHGNDRFRRSGRRGERGRHVHDQHGVVGVVARANARAPPRSVLRRRRRRCRPDWRATRSAAAPHRAFSSLPAKCRQASPPRSASRSTANTPTPPPLVRIASRCRQASSDGRASRRRRTTRRDRARATGRRGGMRRHRPHPSRPARRYASSPPWRPAHGVRI